ncbi:hypothetical protein [Brasilonema sp. UFV-L1]|uniref:hypothetical protein n=1 Tax=Brasilonema sp. UFV-L1 TaxID=2234130 RepID=UPI00145DB73A|nr:hypothetical protein [Brasilonema sp. UFV-L1]NMG11400.1 hypothetical protein [Brasilonema sp. UFV-L1]
MMQAMLYKFRQFKMNCCICSSANQKNTSGLDVRNSKSTKRVGKLKHKQHPWFWLSVNREVLIVKKINKKNPKFMVNFGRNPIKKIFITPMIELVSRLVKEHPASIQKNNHPQNNHPQGGRQ